jgi:ubiquinone/menaquinone biosynthesis C-methylase UbiE
MKIEWKVDTEVQRKAWARIKAISVEVSGMVSKADLIVDLGGGDGWFGQLIARGHQNCKIVSVDISPRMGRQDVSHLQASALDIPVKGSKADIVCANAILHHVPDDLDKCISEVARILKPEGLFLVREPLADNPIAKWARGAVTTDIHEEGECPLAYIALERSITKHLKPEKVEFFFLTSYLLPHLTARVPRLKRLALFLIEFDKKVLANMPKMRKYAAYVSIIARKPKT